MNNIVAFADEYGNNSFEFDKQGTHFIVASVIISNNKLKEIESEIEAIRKKYFQTGEMKSSKVGDNHKRRIVILNELVKSNFAIYAVVVDKRKLSSEGFKYKGSFYKFLNGLVYKELYKTFPSLSLAVDEHGGNDFMLKFKSYVQKNHIPNLFSAGEFDFISSPESILIQLADFVAGTLGRCFDETKKSSESSEFLNILQPRITSINNFPPQLYYLNYEGDENDLSYNPQIAEIGRNSALQFIEKTKVKSQDETDQINCVKLLLLYFNHYNMRNYLSTKEIIRHLQIGRKEPLKEHYFRTKIIGKIRDAGVLIVSSSAGERGGGYKLPSSLEDLYKFINHGKSVILPMLKRIKIFRDLVKLATQNDIDILDKNEFKEIQAIIDRNTTRK